MKYMQDARRWRFADDRRKRHQETQGFEICFLPFLDSFRAFRDMAYSLLVYSLTPPIPLGQLQTTLAVAIDTSSSDDADKVMGQDGDFADEVIVAEDPM
jgi:hypothetical protein